MTRDEAALLELNWPRLGRAIGKAFECDYRETGLHLPLTRQIGSKFANAVPVVLTIQDERDDFRQVVAGVLAQLGRPFILLGPTSRFLDANSIGLLHGARAEFFDLASHVTLLPGGVLQARKNGGELFARFLPERQDELRQSEAVRIFAILQKLKSKASGTKAPLCDVFVFTVLEGLSQRVAAERCGCSVGQLSKRVGELEREFGLPLERLKAFASPILEMQSSVKGQRQRGRKPGSGAGAFADDEPSEDGEDSLPKEEYRHGEGDDDG
ncbi:MAG: LysR family transcriptional regulator [Verrucomicrobiota bacterium]